MDTIAVSVPAQLISELVVDDPDMRDLVEEFVDELPGRLDEMRTAARDLDFDQLQTLAHRLKGAGGSYGYPPLTQAAAQLEEQFRRHSIEQLDESLQLLDEIVTACQRGLK